MAEMHTQWPPVLIFCGWKWQELHLVPKQNSAHGFLAEKPRELRGNHTKRKYEVEFCTCDRLKQKFAKVSRILLYEEILTRTAGRKKVSLKFSINRSSLCSSAAFESHSLPRSLLVGWVLWHINICRLFNAKSIFYANSQLYFKQFS